MGEIVNLRSVKKARAKAEAEREAAANRTKFGRTGAQKRNDRMEQERGKRALDGAKRDDEA